MKATARQLEVLRAIASESPPPTIRELGEKLAITSTNAVKDHLIALRARGLLEWLPFKSRGLRLTPAGRKALELPCCPCRGCGCACHEGHLDAASEAVVQAALAWDRHEGSGVSGLQRAVEEFRRARLAAVQAVAKRVGRTVEKA